FSEAVLNSLPSVFYMFDQSGKFLRWNKNFEKISGYSPEEIKQMTPLDFFVDSDKKPVKQKIQEAFKKGFSDVEAEVVTKSGKTMVYYFSSQATQVEGEMCLIGTGVDITERKRMEDDLRRAMKEKEMLMREVHHRVKNNLLTLYSLVNLQKMSLRDGLSAEKALEDTKQRISAIGRVHRMLYLSKDFAEIDFRQYIISLVDEINITHVASDCKIKIDLDLQPAVLNIDTAISCGLIINELLVNSFRHAFIGRAKGRISVSLENKENFFELKVCDDGIGMPGNPLLDESKTLGIKLVVMLAKQIKAKISYKAQEGSLFTIVFKNATIEPSK
ncbi:MAG TPA: histidine kinase dimerization/phosphoacceptor domain -containing protein, partial [Candidatus Omnitrophota bacterium]|nr:histidine kinase dimerization/phosphoacceptor domain -containing protein [Candidatus Omnitrophota bacterium]